jgi:hypothetical protein
MNFGELMRQVAPLLGYDPSKADHKGEARYRPHGSLCIDFRRGLFADHAAGEAGGVMAFIKAQTGEKPREWLRRNHIESPEPSTERKPSWRREDNGAEFRELTADELERATAARAIWDEAEPIAGVPAVQGYLYARCLEPATSELRFLARLYQLMEPGVTLDGAWHEINRCRPAPKATVDALMLSLRRGVAELVKSETLQRLSVLDDGQIEDVCLRVQAFQPAIAPTWSAADADLLISAWRKLREQHR